MTTSKCKVCGKPLSPSSGDIGKTCQDHAGKLRQFAKIAEKAPEGWLRMSKVCEAAVAEGLTISSVVNAAGGDAVTKPLLDPVFEVVYVGRGKFMNPEVLTKGFALLREHQAQKAKAPASKADAKSETAGKLQQVVK